MRSGTWLRPIALCGIACAAIALTSFHAAAQDNQPNYQELPLHPKAPKWTSLTILDERRAVDRMLRGNEAMNNQAFDAFFNEIVFPLFTQWRDVQIGGKTVSPFSEGSGTTSPAQMRRRFRNDYFGVAAAAARDRLNDLVIAKMDEIASGNFHPVVRVNAILLVGELDEMNGSPVKKALPVLLKASTSASLPEAVRIAATRGLVRQAMAGIDANLKPQVATGMLAILNQPQPLAGHSTQGHQWMRRRALDVLVTTSDAAGEGLAKALWQIVDDPAAGLPLRADAAATMSKIKAPPPASATAAAKSLGKIAVDAYKSELSGRTNHQLPIVPDRLKNYLSQVRRGLVGPDGNGGLAAQATAAGDQQYIRGVVAQIEALAKAADTPLTTVPPNIYGTKPPPVDIEAPLATAIAKAGADLEAGLAREGAAPSGVPGLPPAAVPVGQRQPPGIPPAS